MLATARNGVRSTYYLVVVLRRDGPERTSPFQLCGLASFSLVFVFIRTFSICFYLAQMAPLFKGRIRTDTDHGESDNCIAGGHNGLEKNTNSSEPPLFHKIKNRKSILALTVSDSRIYAGTQDGEILVRKPCPQAIASKSDILRKVWSLETYELQCTVAAHGGSILCLFLSADKRLLLSSAGDAIVNVRDIKFFIRLLLLNFLRYGAHKSSRGSTQSIPNMMLEMFSASCTLLSYKLSTWAHKIRAYK